MIQKSREKIIQLINFLHEILISFGEEQLFVILFCDNRNDPNVIFNNNKTTQVMMTYELWKMWETTCRNTNTKWHDIRILQQSLLSLVWEVCFSAIHVLTKKLFLKFLYYHKISIWINRKRIKSLLKNQLTCFNEKVILDWIF